MSDEWDVFGSDDDESIVNEESEVEHSKNLEDVVFKKALEKSANEITQHITQSFIKANRGVSLKERYFACDGGDDCGGVKKYFNECLSVKIQQRGIRMIEPTPSSPATNDSDILLDGASFFLDFDSAVECPHDSRLRNEIVPGGLLILTMNNVLAKPKIKNASSLLNLWKTIGGEDSFTTGVWDMEHARIIHIDDTETLYIICVKKRPCPINTFSCKWKTNTKRVPTSFQEKDGKIETWIDYERRILSTATIGLSVYEQKEGIMSIESMEKAVNALQIHGFVVLPRLFRNAHQIESITRWSKSFLQDFDSAADILLKEHGVDILHPGKGSDPLSYREMAMREDFRLDLRDGPNIRSMRDKEGDKDRKSLDELGYYCLDGGDGNNPSIIDLQKDQQTIPTSIKRNTDSLRFNPFVLDICRKLLNPYSENVEDDISQPLYKGNFGRWNFSGSGPNGQPQTLRVGQIGSVISLPGCADQCIHADTPHIFETEDCLPCHYANLFIYGDGGKNANLSQSQSQYETKKYDSDGNFNGDNLVGGTAFIHGSHRLSVTARMTADDGISAAGNKEGTQNEMHMRIIRPSLKLGDAIIFDTRTLHFGLANLRESGSRRPMLYVNMTHSWFFDPKNWDNKKSLFST